MATFNTAFGSLPKPKDQVFGNRSQRPAGAAPNAFGQQRSQQAQQANQQRQRERTFAQMQAEGEARPAPQQPTAQNAPMLNELQQKLDIDAKQSQSTLPPDAMQQAEQTRQQQLALNQQQAQAAPQETRQATQAPTMQMYSRTASAEDANVYGQQDMAPEEQQANAAAMAAPVAAPSVAAAAPQAPAAPAATPEGSGIVPQQATNPMIAALQAQLGTAPQATPAAQAGTTPTGNPTTGAGSTKSGDLRSRLEGMLSSYTSGPDAYNDPSYKAYRDAQLANMDAEFGAQRSKLDEEMAARGLAASSISAGRFGDLAGQQARARATMEADLMKDAAARQEARSQFGISQFGNLAELAGKQEISEADIDLRAKQLQQEERLKGRELDLTQARDLASKQIAYAQMANQRSITQMELGSREKIAANELTQRQTEFGVTSQLDRDKLNADIDYRTKQLMADDKRLTYEQARDIANRESDEKREAARLAETTRSNLANEAQSKLDYELRQKLGTSQQALDEKRFQLTENQFAVELSNILASGKLSDAERQALINRYFPNTYPAPATSPSPTPSPTGNTGNPVAPGDGYYSGSTFI